VCQQQYETNPPFSCVADIFSSPLTVLSLAFSNTAALYGVFSLASAFFLRRYWVNYQSSNEEMKALNPNKELCAIVGAVVLCILCCRSDTSTENENDDGGAAGPDFEGDDGWGSGSGRGSVKGKKEWLELRKRRSRGPGSWPDADAFSDTSSVDSERWFGENPYRQQLQGIQHQHHHQQQQQQQQQQEVVSAWEHTKAAEQQHRQQQQKSCTNPADVGSLFSFLGLLDPGADDSESSKHSEHSVQKRLGEALGRVQGQLQALARENETLRAVAASTSERLRLVEARATTAPREYL
jgi:hypothetical protein